MMIDLKKISSYRLFTEKQVIFFQNEPEFIMFSLSLRHKKLINVFLLKHLILVKI